MCARKRKRRRSQKEDGFSFSWRMAGSIVGSSSLFNLKQRQNLIILQQPRKCPAEARADIRTPKIRWKFDLPMFSVLERTKRGDKGMKIPNGKLDLKPH